MPQRRHDDDDGQEGRHRRRPGNQPNGLWQILHRDTKEPVKADSNQTDGEEVNRSDQPVKMKVVGEGQ